MPACRPASLPEFLHLLWPAELPFQEGPVWLACFGRVRIEEEGPPMDCHRAIRLLLAPQFQRAVEMALADEAPGADHVGNDIDRQLHGTTLRVSTVLRFWNGGCCCRG